MKESSISITNVEVETGEDRTTITWQALGEVPDVIIYGGFDPDKIDQDTPLACVSGRTRAIITGLDIRRRHFFKLAPDSGGRVITASRKVTLEGNSNFRDLGGYEAFEGKTIRWGQVYRSDNLARLTDDDLKTLDSMGLKTVVDFRNQDETDELPDRLPEGADINYINLPVSDSKFDPVANRERIWKGDLDWLTEQYMVDNYIRKLENFAHIWGRVITMIAGAKNRPLVFHCTGGKDRAGLTAALTLLALGVNEETVIHDHGLTNVYCRPMFDIINAKLEERGLDPKRLEPWYMAPPILMESSITHINNKYGGALNYLREKAGVTNEIIAKLRTELLE